MADVTFVLVPLAALAYVTVVGAGVAVALAARFPADAQAALAPVAGAALLACASTIVPLGAPARPVAVATAVLGAGATVAYRRRVLAALRRGALPLAVAVCALGLAAAPALARGNWHAASLYASTDPYHWSSQARSYLDGPPARPVADHPDRLTYERPKEEHWAFALSFGTLQLAWVSGADPADVYGALAALVFCLMPLVVFACGRVCLAWRPVWAAVAGAAVALNATLLFASHFGWQQQMSGTAFVLAAAMALRLSFEHGAPWTETALASLLAAASLASYRLGFAPYFTLVLAAIVIAYGWWRAEARRRTVRRAAAFVGAFAVLGAPSVAAILLGFSAFLESGGFATTHKEAWPYGQIAEALGMAPQIWAIEDTWPSTIDGVWLSLGTGVAAGLLLLGRSVLRNADAPRGDFVTAGAAFTVIAYAVFVLPFFSPYLTFKVLAYGSPFLVLLALVPFASGRLRPLVALVPAMLLLPAAGVATVLGARDQVTPGALSSLAAVRVPEAAVVSVELTDPWQQAWATYYLRRYKLSVERPTFVLTGEGRDRDPRLYRHRPVDYVLSARASPSPIWRGGGLTLARAAARG